MIINNCGFNHCHDTDFNIERPSGSGDYLLLLLKSDCVFCINGKDINVASGSFFLYEKSYPQYYHSSDGKLFSNDWIHFDFEPGELECFKKLRIPFNRPVKLDNIHSLSYCIKCIASENCTSHIHKNSLINCYMNIIFLTVSEYINSTNCNSSSISKEILSTIRNKIYAKPYEKRTVASTAHEVRMSPSHFEHMYKQCFGITFINDLINSKIEYAKLHLTQSNISVKQIAEACGYNNPTHFFRQFKKIVNMTPNEYRSLSKVK
ncbi:MAG: helix-turn-helix transcriptional regulator [Oscillospiraceae bacterium]|nr:helix-turn-helix transcriptional regulator [Oscillospiraceae bacterium]